MPVLAHHRSIICLIVTHCILLAEQRQLCLLLILFTSLLYFTLCKSEQLFPSACVNQCFPGACAAAACGSIPPIYVLITMIYSVLARLGSQQRALYCTLNFYCLHGQTVGFDCIHQLAPESKRCWFVVMTMENATACIADRVKVGGDTKWREKLVQHSYSEHSVEWYKKKQVVVHFMM